MTAAPSDSSAVHALWPEVVRLLHADADKGRFSALLEQARALPGRTAGRAGLIRSIELALTVKDRFELHQQRERGLLAVLESAQDLTAIMDPDLVLRAIVQRARKLVGCDIGYLSIFDPGRGDFYVRATDGAFSDDFKRIRIGLDVGVCGFVARNKVPYSSSDYGTDSRFTHTPFIDTAMVEEHITSILGVPLMAGETVIGVLFVGDRYVRAYAPWEKHILSVLGAHASVALGNARLFDQTQQALRQAGDMNQKLARQTADTDTAARAHEQLTALAARGGGLPEICDMVAGMLGGRVVAYDDGEQEIAASDVRTSAGAEASGPVDDWGADALHQALQDSRMRGRSVAVPVPDDGHCRVSAATGGHGMLGGLAIRTDAPLRESEIRIFERSAMVASVVLLSREHRESVGRIDMSALVRSLVGIPRGGLPQAIAQAARHGLDLSRPLHVIVLDGLGDKAAYLRRRLAGVPELARAALDASADTLVILVDADAAPALAQTVSRQVFEILRRPVAGVVSAPVAAPDELRAAYGRVDRCLNVVRALNGQPRLHDERELSLYALLFGNGEGHESVVRYLGATLGPLYVPADARKTALARTLLAYFDGGRNARTAARSLGLHINTVRQRLEALDALAGDWRDPARALDVHVALRLWRLDGGLASPDLSQ
jgi:DNA-binding PucR family transcriptional regulator